MSGPRHGALLVAMCATCAGTARADRALALQPQLGEGVSSQVGDQVRHGIAELAALTGVVVTFGSSDLPDTALLFGCNPDQDGCSERMMRGLEVPELVVIAVLPSGSGYLVQVTRHRSGRPRQRGEILVRAGSDADVRADLAPLLSRLFGAAASPSSPADRPVAEGVAVAPKRASIAPSGKAPRRAAPPPPAPAETAPAVMPKAPAVTSSGPPLVEVASPRHRRRKLMVGLVAGGAVAGTGALLWWRGAQKQDEIETFPDRVTADQLARLLELEDSAASQHRWGNVMVGAGLGVVAGTALWYWLSGDAAGDATVNLAPWTTEGGAGVTLAIGGAR